MKVFVKYIPNSLTVLRIILAAVFPFFYKEYSLHIITLALLTEYFDGALARWLKVESKLGSLLDPIADKLFCVTVAVIIFFDSTIPWFYFLLMGTRDIVVFFGSLVVAIEKNWQAFQNVRPRVLGKVTTTFQFAVIIAYYLKTLYLMELIWVTSILSVLSGIDYLYLFIKSGRYNEKK